MITSCIAIIFGFRFFGRGLRFELIGRGCEGKDIVNLLEISLG